MKFTLLAIGKIKEKWMRQGIEEYVKRLKPIAPLEIIAQDEEKMPENPSPAMKERVCLLYTSDAADERTTV